MNVKMQGGVLDVACLIDGMEDKFVLESGGAHGAVIGSDNSDGTVEFQDTVGGKKTLHVDRILSIQRLENRRQDIIVQYLRTTDRDSGDIERSRGFFPDGQSLVLRDLDGNVENIQIRNIIRYVRRSS